MPRTLIEDIIAEAASGYPTDPIILAAPMQRCGSTLIQRALNQGREAVIFGENFMFMEKLPFQLGGPFQGLELRIRETDAFMEVFRDSARNQDATNLYPDYRRYLVTLLRGFYQVAAQYREEAQALGARHWGIKNQVAELQGFSNALNFMPNAKVVVLYRDLVDAARSFRGRWPQQLATAEQLRALGRHWGIKTEFLLAIRNNKLVIRYEDILSDRDTVIDALESFLDCRIARQAFDTRVNANLMKDQFQVHGAKSVGKYIRPAALSAQEQEVLLADAMQTYRRLGYDPAAHQDDQNTNNI